MKHLRSLQKVLTKKLPTSFGTQDSFAVQRKKLLKISLWSIGLTFVSLAIVGTRLFYPFHVVIGIGVYILSFIPLIRRVYVGRKVWKQYRAYTYSADFFKKEKRRILYALLLSIGVLVFFWLRPLDTKPFAHLSDDEIVAMVADDLFRTVTAMDYLESTGNELLTALDTTERNTNTNEDVSTGFAVFLQAVAYSESLTDTHRYFASIPYRLWNERLTSFLISYSLYAKKYELVHRIMTKVAGDEFLKTTLNQYNTTIDRANIYNEMVQRYYAPKTRLRLTGGYFYLQVFTQTRSADDVFTMLRSKSHESYTYLQSNFGRALEQTGTVLTDAVEQKMFDTWFPIQKSVATGMGRAILTERGKDGFITYDQALTMGAVLQPGDIMLQRRNWHLSNLGIPGFWTHSALYTGDVATMDEFFASEFPYQGYLSLSAYLEAEFPEVFAQYTTPDKDGAPRAVIEAIEAGVVLQSLPTSANADFVVVLRPTIDKKSRMLALIKAFAHIGKPYDFNFDFDTRDALVCSELVYDSYFERLPEKAGVHFATSEVSGRTMVSPYDMARKYQAERNTPDAELAFVYFLRGDENTQTARIATEAEFIESIDWSKFSFLQ